MEGAAARWDTHPGNAMYICTHCGYIHFSTNNLSIIDRLHEKAIRIDQNPIALPGPPIQARKLNLKKKREKFQFMIPARFVGGKGTCKISVWQAKGCSIGELLKLKESK